MSRYLTLFSVVVLTVLAATTGVAWLVDPYAYWNTPVIDGVNRYRPASGKHLLQVKLRQYERLQPTVLVAGNSRVDIGINPASAAWPDGTQPVYNLGLPGYGTEAVVDSIDAALRAHRPARIFIGLDFLDFRIDRERRREKPSRESTNEPKIGQQLKLTIKLLVSLDALKDSAAGLAEQYKRYPADITPQGYNGLEVYNAIVAAEGHAALFEQRNVENMKSYLTRSKNVRLDNGATHPAFAALAGLAERARQQEVELVLFTYPYHADLLMSFELAGLWPAYEDWVNDLAAFSARIGLRTHFLTRIDEMTTEAVPEKGDNKTKMQWYWEGGHFKSSLGDKIIASITASTDSTVLTEENAGDYLAGLKANLARYRNENPAGAERIAAAYKRAIR